MAEKQKNMEAGQNKVQKKVLFLSTLTPPFYGSSISNEMCLDILKESDCFDVKNIKLNYSLNMSDLNKVSLKKVHGIFKVIRQIRFSLKNFVPDVIYFVPATAGHALIRDYLFLKTIKLNKRGKLIIHLRAQFLSKDWDNPLKRYLIRSVLTCDKAIVLGPELIGNLNNSIPKENIYILPNAIPNSLTEAAFNTIIEERGLNTNLRLLFLSNMQDSKGWFKVLEAGKLLNDAGVKFVCHFVGDWTSDKERKKFYSYIESNNLHENIKYHGKLLNSEKNKILTVADILIFPTEYKLETFGRVIIEAMEFGLPVISNTIGTIPSIIKHGETGYVLKENTAGEIYKCVVKLMDKPFRNKMGISGRERFLANYTLDIYKINFEQIINMQ